MRKRKRERRPDSSPWKRGKPIFLPPQVNPPQHLQRPFLDGLVAPPPPLDSEAMVRMMGAPISTILAAVAYKLRQSGEKHTGGCDGKKSLAKRIKKHMPECQGVRPYETMVRFLSPDPQRWLTEYRQWRDTVSAAYRTKREAKQTAKLENRRLRDDFSKNYTLTENPVGVPSPRTTTKVLTWKEQAAIFYASDEWRTLRYEVLRERGGSCELCGRNRREHGVTIHVDHIKPRSKFPELQLVRTNLQVLCEDCNLGKSNTDSIDWSKGPEAGDVIQ